MQVGKSSKIIINAEVDTWFSTAIETLDSMSSKLRKSNSSVAKGQKVTVDSGTPIEAVIVSNGNETSIGIQEWVGCSLNWTHSIIPTDNEIGYSSVVISMRVMGVEISRMVLKFVISASIPKFANKQWTVSSSYSHKRIFLSYSNKDKTIARSIQSILNAFGIEVFMDKLSLKAGEIWEKGIARLIETSDSFHLLWSKNSATSSHVRDEWEYALYLHPETQGENFLMISYWDDEMPPLPKELSHLHACKIHIIN